MHILVSFAVGSASAMLAWFAGALMGIGLMHLSGFDGLGGGVIAAVVTYGLAYLFAIAGLVLTIAYLSKRRHLPRDPRSGLRIG
jgi:hypothetical protein